MSRNRRTLGALQADFYRIRGTLQPKGTHLSLDGVHTVDRFGKQPGWRAICSPTGFDPP